MADPSPSSTRRAVVEALRWTAVVVAYLGMAGLFVGGGVALRWVVSEKRAAAASAERRAADASTVALAPTPTTWHLETTTTTILFRPSATTVPVRPSARAVQAVAVTVPDERKAVWFRLADCESGAWGAGKIPRAGSANWQVVDEIHQGGLQIRAGQWDQHRVRFPGFPDDAHLATPEQQIAVAEVILAGQGVKAWPTCGPRIGLGVLVGQTASASTQASGVVAGA